MKIASLITFVVFSLLLGGCGREGKIQQQKDDAAKREWRNAITNFAQKYSAQTDWESHIPQRGTLKSPFLIDISRTLMPTNGQPVLLVMELKDVIENRSGYSVKFDGYFFENQDFQICLDAKCTPELANRILEISKGKMLEFADFAVVAKIESVSRVGFEVQGTTEGTPAGDSPNLEVIYSPDTFIVRGTCIDVIHREDIVSNQ